jgi:Bacterial capsule synthesis protein PGA_cap
MHLARLIFFIVLLGIVLMLGVELKAQIKINAVGDIMLGSVTPKKILPPEEGREFVESIGELLQGADIVFGNLEGSFIEDEMEPQKCSERSRKAATCYEFGMPEILSESLKEIGFNVVNQDNNHSVDYGEEGYLLTQEKLSELGIKFMPKKGLAEFTIKNSRVALVAFGYSENSYHISDLENAKNVISKLNDKFDIIIVSFHGGAEGKDAIHVPDSTEIYLGENRGNVYAFAHTVIDAGADMVLGHGPHVLRAVEVYKNKLIAYSLGNFLTYGNMNISGITGINIILHAEIDEQNGNFIRGKLISVRQVDYGIPVPDKSYEGFYLIKELSSEDIPNLQLLFVGSDRIYNFKIFTPPIREMESTKNDFFGIN